MKRILILSLFSLLSMTVSAQIDISCHSLDVSGSFLWNLSESPDGSLWASADNGELFHFVDEVWEKQVVSGTTDELRHVLVISNDDIWVGSGNEGLYHYNGTIWENYNTSNSDLLDNWIRDIALHPDGSIYIATPAGLNTIDDNNQWKSYTTSNSDLKDDHVYDVLITDSGIVYLANDDELVKIEEGNWESYNLYAYGTPLRKLALKGDNQIYVTMYYGLVTVDFSDTEPVFEFLADSFKNWKMSSIEVDQNGTLWLADGFFGKLGVKYLIDSSFTFGYSENTCISSNMSDILVDQNNVKWVVSGRKILEIHDEGYLIQKDVSHDNQIKIYPNITSDYFKIAIDKSSSYRYDIISMDGKVSMKSDGFHSLSESIDISNLINGIYYVRIMSSTNEINIQKLIKI